MLTIAPSILAADFARLGEQVRETELGGADRVHVDVMDGHFVPNLSMGPVVVKALRPVTKLPLEVHLMVNDPARFADAFLKAGADTLIVHHEVLPDAGPLILGVRQRGKRVGVAINPGTPVEVLERYLPEIDLALCMTVHPGFGGQSFIADVMPKVRKARDEVDRRGLTTALQVDGGIKEDTAPVAAEAGADVFVAGNAVFRDPDPAAAAARIRAAASGA